MPEVVVHHFKIWDTTRGEHVVPPNGGQPSKRTAENITSIGGEIIPNTAETVDATSLDAHGRYLPKKHA
jgi:hypothetical protein